jgi:hypothetical protein
MEIKVSNKILSNISQVNILLGKNGCGKSSLLRLIDSQSKDIALQFPSIKYISPERGGELSYDSGIEQNILNNSEWLSLTRRKDHDQNFRQKSLAQLRSLEGLINRAILNDEHKRYHTKEKFEDTLVLINDLLDNIYVSLEDKIIPLIKGKDNGEIRNSDQLCSEKKS